MNNRIAQRTRRLRPFCPFFEFPFLPISLSLSLSLSCFLFCLFSLLCIRTARETAFRNGTARSRSPNASPRETAVFLLFIPKRENRSAGDNSQSLAIFLSVAVVRTRAHTHTYVHCCTRVKFPPWRTAKGLISSHLVAF